ncbi:hypothetical protein QRO11_03710 [Paracidovorax citrulli]|uniref:hypothetical protein n=1 Tax=Paracidovorax citrulli TaxID=80869 RepID=UPI00088721A3|nr:hypothetical protein [Paracidovorax citrulli]UMT89762.1 hypothetical protein FRC90_17945 [Paracidovorax citrulli]WIY35458.1 hypothetical protein QRO11_03710 [Paracidovorax citrulli]SDJ08036.1 hypothetical protein SAMN04489709_101177 [Paracidovorax citrulli]
MKEYWEKFSRDIGKPVLAMVLTMTFALALWWLWAAFGVQWTKQFACPSDATCEQLGQVGDLFGGVNALFAGLAFGGVLISIHITRKAQFEQRQLDRDEKILGQICSSYQWAYDVLAEGRETEDAPPKADRLSWLIAARHLLRAEKLTDSLRTELFQTMQAEQEEYWRTKFYKLLNHKELSNYQYYMNPSEVNFNLDARSVFVVAEFTRWVPSRYDPIDSIDLVEADPDWTRSTVGRGLEKYIIRANPPFGLQIAERHREKREEKKRKKTNSHQ